MSLLLVACLVLSSGCSRTPYLWANSVPAERAAPLELDKKINAGDTISVAVFAQQSLSGEHVVGTDGAIVIPNVGAVRVMGKTPGEAADRLKERLSLILDKPRVTVIIVVRRIEVGILGEVNRPGKYMVKSGEGVASAIAMAGGLTEFADDKAIYLVRDTEPLRIRFRMKDLVRGGNSATAFALRDGDLLVVE